MFIKVLGDFCVSSCMKRLWLILYLLPLLAQNSSSPSKVIQQNKEVTLIQEAGYILAMQTVFIGTSILSSKKKLYGHVLVSGFDLFMSVAGIKNASNKQLEIQRNGYYLLGLGFLSKSIYNTGLINLNHSKTKFWINYISFNILVYSGYYLDSLDEDDVELYEDD